MLTILQNARVYAPEDLGKKNILCSEAGILSISEQSFSVANESYVRVMDCENKILVPGFIDQHVHIDGAGGGKGFASRTSEVSAKIDCWQNGLTTVVGLLGTDGVTRSLQSLYAKAKKLEGDGVNTWMYTSYYGYPPLTICETVKEDMIFIDKVLGCKIAISDVRSSYPTQQELLRLLHEVRIGGMTAGKKGILHVHLGNAKSGLQPLLALVKDYHFPIENISPTHCGRTKDLFLQSLEFARLGGSIDITTGASKFAEPHEQVLLALEEGITIDSITFSSDGHAGLSRSNKNEMGKDQATDKDVFFPAPLSQGLQQIQKLIRQELLPISAALKLMTVNPAKNLGLNHVGQIAIGMQADFCLFREDWQLEQVIVRGLPRMAG